MTGVWYSGVQRGLEHVITTQASAAQILRRGLSVELGLPASNMVCGPPRCPLERQVGLDPCF